MDPLSYFSNCYETARQRFIEVLKQTGWSHEAHAIDARGPTGAELTIDVGIRRSAEPKRTVVISSGLHGVEGFFGSAVQMSLLDDQQWLCNSNETTVVMIHALNPFGFAWKRRWNEDNVDLNRSFFSLSNDRPETLPSFHKIDAVLNPQKPAGRLDLFPITATWFIARHGFAELKRTLPVGQYDNPLGIFYGGRKPSATQKILEQNLARWIGSTSDVLHLDFHTGLGRSGDYTLLLNRALEDAVLNELGLRFGDDALKSVAAESLRRVNKDSIRGRAMSSLQRFLAGSGIAYPAHGLMSDWLRDLFPDISYLTLSAEFGTYPSIRVLQSLIAENRSYHWGRDEHSMELASDDLMEMFVPASPRWRSKAIIDAQKICRQAL